mgnify:CR=1 FL=1
MFAIVLIGNKQYKVEPNDVITVDKIDGKEGDSVEFSDVLLVKDDKAVKVGTPNVKGAVVKAKIVKHELGEKVEIRRFKSQVRYRRRKGFRAQLTKLEIVSVS